jgi:hypothetical protein
MANFETNALPADPAMLNKLIDILVHLARGWELNALGASDFLQSGTAWTRGLPHVCGHHNCVATACPGQNLYAQMDYIRNQIATRVASGAAPSLTTGPDGVTVPRGSLAYAWSGPVGTQYASYLEGWSKAATSEDISYLTGFSSDRRPVWSGWSSATSRSFSGLKDGRYTFHVRGMRDGQVTYQNSRTVNMAGQAPGGGGSGGGKRR